MAKREILGSSGTMKIYKAKDKKAEFDAIIREYNRIFKKGKGAIYEGYAHDDRWKDWDYFSFLYFLSYIISNILSVILLVIKNERILQTR